MARKIQEEDRLINEQLVSLEEKLIDFTLEKNKYEFLYNIIIRFVFNIEILELLEEMKIVLNNFNIYEKTKATLER